jgi:hypothetical protein
MKAVGAATEPWPGSTPTGRTRTFEVTVSKTVRIAIDESVIAQGVLPDNPIFGESVTEDDVIQHLAFNLVGNGLRLSQIDGYANCADASVTVPYGYWDVDVEHEIVPTPGHAKRSARRRK